MALPEKVVTVTLSSWLCSRRALSSQGVHFVLFLEILLKARNSTEAGGGQVQGQREAGHCGDQARQRLGLMGGGWEGEGLDEGRREQVWTAHSKG